MIIMHILHTVQEISTPLADSFLRLRQGNWVSLYLNDLVFTLSWSILINHQPPLLSPGIRDPLNVLIWAKTGPTLAIGSYRGNLMIYNHKTARRVPVIGEIMKKMSLMILK